MRKKSAFAGFVIALMALIGAIFAYTPSPSPIKVFISGGVGCKMGVINNGNKAITASYAVDYWNMGNHHIEGIFDVPQNSVVEKTFHVFSIFSPITASINAGDEAMTKNGYIFLFFVVFPD